MAVSAVACSFKSTVAPQPASKSAASAGAMHGKYQCFLFPIGLLLCFLSRLTAGMGFSLMPRPKFWYYCNTCSANCGKKSEISSFPDGWLFRNFCAAFWKHSVRLPCHAAMLPHGRSILSVFLFTGPIPMKQKSRCMRLFRLHTAGFDFNSLGSSFPKTYQRFTTSLYRPS